MKNYFISIFALAVMVLPASAFASFSCYVATSCASTSAEIVALEMTNNANAHAGLPGAGYPYKVCCVGAEGLSGSCSDTSSQIIAKLSGERNAHVRENTLPDYPGSHNACLAVTKGTITIGYQDGNCDGYSTTVASMAKTQTNSHIGEADAYVHKICARYESGSSGTDEDEDSGGGGGSSSPVDSFIDSVVSQVQEIASSLNSDVSDFLGAVAEVITDGGSADFEIASSGGHSEAIGSEDSLAAVFEDLSRDNSVQEPAGGDNSLLAAAGTAESKFTGGIVPIIIALISILGLVFIGKKLYFKG